MVDELAQDAQARYQRAWHELQQGAAPEALVGFKTALEKLVRWSMIRDGGDVDVVTDPGRVAWQDLIKYLEWRVGVSRADCIILTQMIELSQVIESGRRVPVTPETIEGDQQLVTALFRRLFPRTQAEREQVEMRAAYGRPRPVADLTARPPDRIRDTEIIVPPPAGANGGVGAARRAPAGRPPEPPAPPGAPAPGAARAAAHPAAGPPEPAPAAAPGPARDAVAPAADRSGAILPFPGPASGERAVAATSAAAAPGGSAPPAAAAPPPPWAMGGADRAELQQRAIAAGQRLREMRLQGVEYCPRCGAVVPAASPTCPHCAYNLDAYRAQLEVPPAPAVPRLLDRLWSRKR